MGDNCCASRESEADAEGRGRRVLSTIPTENWIVISSIATAITAIVALFTVIITLNANSRSRKDMQLTVQPWFYIQLVSNMGARAPVRILIANDGYLNVAIQKVELILINGNKKEKLEFKYLKKDDKYTNVGKYFAILIPWNEELYGKPFQIKLTYLNLYKQVMSAYSGRLNFVERQFEGRLLEIEKDNTFYRPFINQLK